MRVVDIIRKKRDGGELTRPEIEYFVGGYTRGDIPDYQASAWLMAMLLRGLSRAELVALTDAMLHSGQVLDLSDIPGVKVDKHSTGGVGDKTSLVLAPAAAAAGVIVPMISGRGLAHTGGTLDKLEAIHGFDVNLSLARFRQVLARCGCAMIGQTDEIAPADRKLYALRDVTGTVETPYLISASIMSKKLAEGIDALVLDVKYGSGAFMKTEREAVYLAKLMVETGERMGKRVVALITMMDQPLGNYIGNALEVEECLAVMNGRGPDDLRDLCEELTGWMLYLGRKAKSPAEGKKQARHLIAGGAARHKFEELVRLQSKDLAGRIEARRLPRSRNRVEIKAPRGGFVQSIACEQVGIASMVLGGGRERKEDTIDHAVGIVLHSKVGDPVRKGEPLCTLHYNSDARLDEAMELIRHSYSVGPKKPRLPKTLVRRIIGKGH
jgi:pyrimidine-nucleoside phosphorylase/thymidine phosphorylase